MSYAFHQSHQQITILLEVPLVTRVSDVELHLTDDTVIAGIKGVTPLLKGRFVSSIDPASSTWYLERRPGEPRWPARRAASDTQSSSSASNGEELSHPGSSPSADGASPVSASSFDFVGGIRHRRGPVSETSLGSSGEWTHGLATSDEGEIVEHPSSPSATRDLPHSGFSFGSDPSPSAPPSMETSSILQLSSEYSGQTISTTSTGSAPQSSSSGAGAQPGGTPLASGQTRLLTLHLVKATPKFWEGAIIVDGVDEKEVAPGVPNMDATSLAALASELTKRSFHEREQGFAMLLYAHSVEHLSLASHLLLLDYFAPPILSSSDDHDANINPSHLLRLGGTPALAVLYLQFARLYLTDPLPPPPPHHRSTPLSNAARPSARRQKDIAKSLLTQALIADPKVTVDDAHLKALAKEMGFKRSRGGIWRRAARGRATGRPGLGLRSSSTYLLGSAALIAALAAYVWWKRRPPANELVRFG